MANNGLVNPNRPLPRRIANASARARAQRLVQIGNAQFQKARYHVARERFKDASRAAPDMAEAHFRQGHALMAMGHYDRAVEAYKRGLALKNDWPQSNFHWDQLYGNNAELKRTHADQLATHVEEDPDDGERLFLLGVFLHFDGQPQRAQLFFQRAKQLLSDVRHLEAFLSVAQRDGHEI
jgi:tetratricopeptide (TPR) repeat protein